MKLHYGGELEFGDFIAISCGNHIDFGFYAGTGRGTLQYYPFTAPINAHDHYQRWLAQPEEERAKNWYTKRYKKGFTSKCIWKAYINTVHKTRVIKLVNPETIFTNQEDLENYNESREVLIKIGMIKN